MYECRFSTPLEKYWNCWRYWFSFLVFRMDDTCDRDIFNFRKYMSGEDERDEYRFVWDNARCSVLRFLFILQIALYTYRIMYWIYFDFHQHHLFLLVFESFKTKHSCLCFGYGRKSLQEFKITWTCPHLLHSNEWKSIIWEFKHFQRDYWRISVDLWKKWSFWS